MHSHTLTQPKIAGDKLSVVIQVSEFHEPATAAVTSILENRAFIEDVHIVQYGYINTLPHWDDLMAKLSAVGLTATWHSQLDASKLRCKAVVVLPADLYAGSSAFEALRDTIDAYGGQTRGLMRYGGYDQFAVSSTVYNDAANVSVSYGWLCVILVLDTLRQWINFGHYHRSCDLRAFAVSSYWSKDEPRVSLPPHRWWRWWIGTGVCPPLSVGSACTQIPQLQHGFAFVLRTLKTHQSMGLGIWLLGFLLYYGLFAIPWWGALINEQTRLWWIARSGTWWNPLSWTWYWLTAHLLHMAAVGVLVYSNIILANANHMATLFVLAYPLYLTLMPALLIYAALYRSTATYQAAARAVHDGLDKNDDNKIKPD